MVVKMDIAANHLVGFREGSRFVAVNTLRFGGGEENFRHGVVIWGLQFAKENRQKTTHLNPMRCFYL